MAQPAETSDPESDLTPEQKIRRAIEGIRPVDAKRYLEQLANETIEHVSIDRFRRQSKPDEAMPDDATDAKIAAAEARTDAKFAAYQGQFSVLAEKLDNITENIREQRAEARSNRTAILTTVVGVGVALAALLWAAITYGDSVFSHGMSVRDVVDVAVRDALKQMPAK